MLLLYFIFIVLVVFLALIDAGLTWIVRDQSRAAKIFMQVLFSGDTIGTQRALLTPKNFALPFGGSDPFYSQPFEQM